ncbi:MAG TPA: hypothetical protein VF175_05985, partial [Lacipirellula sp.]
MAVFLALTAVAPPCAAGIQQIAITGDPQPGSAGAQLLGVSSATLNGAGEVAFIATLKPGVGGVDATNDRAICR